MNLQSNDFELFGLPERFAQDRAAMDATRDMISGMRDEFSARMGVMVTEEAEFEVVMHSLRVPELV